MRFRQGLLSVIVSSLSASAAQSESPSDWYSYHFDERVPLALDSNRVGIRFSDTSRSAQPDLQTEGIAAGDVERWPIAGWHLAKAPEAKRSGDGIADLVARLAGRNDLAFSTPVFVGRDGGPVMITSDLLVGFHPGVSVAEAEAVLQSFPTETIVERDWAGMEGVYKLRSALKSGFDVLAQANALAQLAVVRFAEPDVIFTGEGSLIPNDTGFVNCWGIRNTGQFGGSIIDMDMDGSEAWDLTTGDPSILVVVIDTGVEQDHPDLHQFPGTDTTSDASTTGDPVNVFDNHGTAVAGCVSATINNNLGTVGIAPGCRAASARTFIGTNSSGNWTSTASWTVDSLAWAESIGARVTNNSNSYGFESSAIESKYADTRNAGMVHFSSVHNDGVPEPSYPARLPTVNGVAALRFNGLKATFSNFGLDLAYSAPGETIYSTDRTGADGYYPLDDYGMVQGTSFASPYTAGVAALVLSVRPQLDAFGVEQILQQTCVDRGAAGYDLVFGWGFVNAFQAVMDGIDCNSNGVADATDILLGAADLDLDGVPDVCEVGAMGQCCDGAGGCSNLAERSCLALGRTWHVGSCAAVECPPVNDRCSDAEVIPCGSGVSSVTFDNAGFINFASPSYGCAFNGASSVGTVWYQFVATEDGAEVSTCNSVAQDSIMAAYSGNCGALFQIECSDDAFGACGSRSRFTLSGLVPGNTYYLQVSAWNNQSSGSYTLDLECVSQTPPVVAPTVPGGQAGFKKNRYVSFVPSNGSTAVNYRVRHAASGRMKWVAGPAAGLESAHGVGRLTGDGLVGTMPGVRVWGESVIHATGCLTSPVQSYEVAATIDGATFSPALTVMTIDKPGLKFWADTNGSLNCPLSVAYCAPDGSVNFVDIAAAVQRFQNTGTAPLLVMVDLEPGPSGVFPNEQLNIILNFADINRIVQGFMGQTYPFFTPAACP